MRVSGFTFVRDAVRLGFPVVESIRSVLPLVDEMIVNVGVSDDGTRELVASIGDPRIVILDSVWDPASRERGRVLAEQTDIALDACGGDVCLYVQADEALHEDDHPRLREAMRRLHETPRWEGLLVDYLHFYGSYHTVGASRRWYRREVRVVKNGVGVRSYKDAQGFRVWEPPPGHAGPPPRSLVSGDPSRKLRVGHSGVRMYHYGWVRPPALQRDRLVALDRVYQGAEAKRGRMVEREGYDVTEKVRPFTGTHPGPMRARVAAMDWEFTPRPRRLRFRNLDQLREDVLDLVEAATGVRIGEYRNYEWIE